MIEFEAILSLQKELSMEGGLHIAFIIACAALVWAVMFVKECER